MKRKILKTTAGILIAVFFLYLTLKNQPIDEIFKVVLKAKWEFIFLAAVFYFLSYIARSEKWRIQLANVNLHVSSPLVFFSVMMHYFTDSFTVKLGVVVRCISLKKNTKINITPCAGTCLSETVFDLIFLFLGILIVLLIRFEQVSQALLEFWNNFDTASFLAKPGNIVLTIIVIALIFIGIKLLIRKGMKLTEYRDKILEFGDILKKTFKIKKFWLFFMWNIALWAMLYFMNLFLFKALFDDEITFLFIYSVTTFTYLAWLLPNPGGIGSVEYFVLKAFLIFGFAEQSAIAFGFLSNGFTLFANLLFGFALIILQKFFGMFPKVDYLEEAKKLNAKSSKEEQQ